AGAVSLRRAIADSVVGQIIADQLADHLRGGEVLAGTQLLERLLLFRVDKDGEPGGFSFHGNCFVFGSNRIVRNVGRFASWPRRSGRRSQAAGALRPERALMNAARAERFRPGRVPIPAESVPADRVGGPARRPPTPLCPHRSGAPCPARFQTHWHAP